MLSFDDFKQYYEKYGFLPNDTSRRRNRLNERQLESRYKAYQRSQEKARERQERQRKKVRSKPTETVKDSEWEAVKSVVFERDQWECQLWKALTPYERSIVKDHLGGEFLRVDPAHVFGKGAHPHLKYDPDNIVALYRLFHSRLDQMRCPITGELTCWEYVEAWWVRIVGKERYAALKKKAKKQ